MRVPPSRMRPLTLSYPTPFFPIADLRTAVGEPRHRAKIACEPRRTPGSTAGTPTGVAFHDGGKLQVRGRLSSHLHLPSVRDNGGAVVVRREGFTLGSPHRSTLWLVVQ